MTQITSGIVMYSRVVKDDDYGIKREAKVELSFMVAEGETPGLDAVKDLALSKVHEMLRVAKPATKSEPAGAASPQASVPSLAPPAAPAAPAPAKPTAAAAPLNDKEKLAVEAGLREAPPVPRKKKAVPEIEPVRQISTGEERKDPNDDLDALFGDAPKPREVTDKELNEKVQARVAALKSSAAVIQLKEKYVGPMPKTLRDVPQDKREKFLEDLAALKAA